ncbi:MAG TPA: DMT family transporter [Candidatus Methylomirabilis sp.]|nr:DMT family transporter [Candidatus Methylomirabilis sp.]
MVKHGQWRGYAMIVGAAFCWGIMAAMAKLLFRDRGVDPLSLVVIRAYLATGLLFGSLAILAPGWLRITGADFRAAAVVGVGGLLTNNFLYFEAIHLTSVATALLLQYQAPVLVALYVFLVQRHRVSGRLVGSLVLTIGGCALVVRAYDPAAIRLNLLGVLAGVGTAFAFAFYILSSRAALRSMRSWTLVAYGYLAASLVWLPIVPPWRLAAAGFPPEIWWAFLAIASVGTVIPFGLFIGGLRYLPPTQASILAMLEPVIATVAAYLLLGETLFPLQILGGGLVLAGVIMVQTT